MKNLFRKLKNGEITFGLKIGLAIILLTTITTGSTSLIIYTKTRNMLIELMGNRLKDIASTGAFLLEDKDREAIKKLHYSIQEDSLSISQTIKDLEKGAYSPSLSPEKSEKYQKTPEFQRLIQQLRKIKYASKNQVEPLHTLDVININQGKTPLVKYVYLFVTIPESPDLKVIKFLADADYDKYGEENPIGNLYGRKQEAFLKAFKGETAAENKFQNEFYGNLLSAATPILDSKGEIIAILGLDYDAKNEAAQLSKLKYICLAIFIFAIVASLIISFFITQYLASPIEKLRLGAERVKKRDFSTHINIKQKDELGLLADTFNSMITEIRDYTEEMENLNAAYFRFIPKEFLDHLGAKNLTEVSLGDQVQREMSVLFSDIRSFTTISEGMTPSGNFNFLNAYLNKVAPIIRDNNGFIDKYIGDAIMALFPTSADDAVHAAINMRRELRNYNQTQLERGNIPVNIGIGIHTGSLILGTIGEKERMQTTVISDAVNIASRLEGLTKKLQTHIIISEHTFNGLQDKSVIGYRYLGKFMVKGKSQAIKIYEVFEGEPAEIIDLRKKTKEQFEKGIFFFFKGRLGEASDYFEQVLAINPNDEAAKFYLKRCLHKEI